MALEAGVSETGCTVHVVTDDVDRGPIIEQRRVEVRPDDTLETLRARIQEQEHVLLPAVVKRIAGQALPLRV
jgi:phosphoribosylglycinamide formyltransferase-1